MGLKGLDAHSNPRRQLLAINPDNYRVHEGLQRALGLSAPPGGALSGEQRAGLKALYAQLSAEYPRSAAVQRIPLDFTVSFGIVFNCVASAVQAGAVFAAGCQLQYWLSTAGAV